MKGLEDDGEKKWISLMIRTAKKYHKLCPYFDKKGSQCLLMATMEGKLGRCDREGRFEGCPTFTRFLETIYHKYTSQRKVLPRDFQDLMSEAFLL